jgi:hypothetical protein
MGLVTPNGVLSKMGITDGHPKSLDRVLIDKVDQNPLRTLHGMLAEM